MSTEVRRAIYGKLAGDSAVLGKNTGGTALLGVAAPGYAHAIYHEIAPADANFPYIVFGKSSGVPTEAFGDPSAYETDVWMVKAVDRRTTAGTAEAISARVQTLLNDGTISISGGTALYLRRQSDVEYTEVTAGEVYRHAGSLYRLVYDST